MHSAPPTPPFYTDAELDALYEKDPVEAMRLSRRQALWLKALEEAPPANPDAPPTWEQVAEVLQQARQVLLQDGGDLELVAIEEGIVRIRLKGNCVGCPRSALDLKNVVERAVRRHFPQIRKVENTF